MGPKRPTCPSCGAKQDAAAETVPFGFNAPPSLTEVSSPEKKGGLWKTNNDKTPLVSASLSTGQTTTSATSASNNQPQVADADQASSHFRLEPQPLPVAQFHWESTKMVKVSRARISTID